MGWTRNTLRRARRWYFVRLGRMHLQLLSSPLLALVLACTPEARSLVASPEATQLPSARAASTRPSSAASAMAAIAPSDLAPLGSLPSVSGPIRVAGYPHNVRNGMNDPAQWVGWSKDGESFGYCQQGSGRDSQDTGCRFLRTDGSYEVKTTDGASREHADPLKLKEIQRWLADNEIPRLTERDGMTALPQPLHASWTFLDIELAVARIAATVDKAGGVAAPAHVEVGGSVEGETPVYPVTLVAPLRQDDSGKPYPRLDHFAVMNGMSVSPDGRELGVVAHFFACEWCDSWEVRRMPLASVASLVYNDTGFRHHQRKEWALAAKYFLKAALADPTAKLPAYNLACALSQEKDPKAEVALAAAIGRGGADVVQKAKADGDFDRVRGEAWFRALVH